jgi:hypothetical protein
MRLPLTNVIGQAQMDKYIFFCCRQALVIIGDFIAGLAKACAEKAIIDAKEAKATGKVLSQTPNITSNESQRASTSPEPSILSLSRESLISSPIVTSDTIVVEPPDSTFRAPDVVITPNSEQVTL